MSRFRNLKVAVGVGIAVAILPLVALGVSITSAVVQDFPIAQQTNESSADEVVVYLGGDSIEDATPIELNSTSNGNIVAFDDSDYFRFDTPQDGNLTVFTEGTTNLFGTLYNADNEIVFERGNGDNDNFRFTAGLSAGTYYLAVNSDGDDAGDYVLNVAFDARDFPADDHGNDIATATAIELDSTARGNIERVGDTDYFAFDVPRSGTLTIFSTGSTRVSGGNG